MKWSGMICYRHDEPKEVSPGVYEDVTHTFHARGEIQAPRVNNQNDSKTVHDHLRLNNVVSIVASPFTLERMHNIIWVTVLRQKYQVESIQVVDNKLQLQLGGIFHDRPKN